MISRPISRIQFQTGGESYSSMEEEKIHADFIRTTFPPVRLTPKGRNKIRSSGMSEVCFKYSSCFLRLCQGFWENMPDICFCNRYEGGCEVNKTGRCLL